MGTGTITVAYLDSSMDFPWTRLAGERSNAPFLFLRHRARGLMAFARTAENLEHPTLDWAHNNGLDLCRLGDSVREDSGGCPRHSRLVATVFRTPRRRRV